MSWYSFDGGRSIGARGSEDGVIILDEESDAGARVTLERSGRTAPSPSPAASMDGWHILTFLEPRLRHERRFRL
jgi:hypothetical protein